jgi:hypothetical protein
MTTKLKYPKEFLSVIGLNINQMYIEQIIVNTVLNCCTKKYGTIYNMPDNIYQQLKGNNDYNEHPFTNNMRQIGLSEIKMYIKNLGINHISSNIYISVTDIYSTNNINEITVKI